jgi:hypothetical protein
VSFGVETAMVFGESVNCLKLNTGKLSGEEFDCVRCLQHFVFVLLCFGTFASAYSNCFFAAFSRWLRARVMSTRLLVARENIKECEPQQGKKNKVFNGALMASSQR